MLLRFGVQKQSHTAWQLLNKDPPWSPCDPDWSLHAHWQQHWWPVQNRYPLGKIYWDSPRQCGLRSCWVHSSSSSSREGTTNSELLLQTHWRPPPLQSISSGEFQRGESCKCPWSEADKLTVQTIEILHKSINTLLCLVSGTIPKAGIQLAHHLGDQKTKALKGGKKINSSEEH
jgi:hypothetical protein